MIESRSATLTPRGPVAGRQTGLLSDVTYEFVAGTSVARHFVELPSQLYEHWLETPEVLETHARHATTGAPMPRDLMDRVIAARNFNQGFATVEYLASALVDLDFHAGPAGGRQAVFRGL